MIVLSAAEIERLLAEDAPYGDLTTDALGIGAMLRRSQVHSFCDGKKSKAAKPGGRPSEVVGKLPSARSSASPIQYEADLD